MMAQIILHPKLKFKRYNSTIVMSNYLIFNLSKLSSWEYIAFIVVTKTQKQFVIYFNIIVLHVDLFPSQLWLVMTALKWYM